MPFTVGEMFAKLTEGQRRSGLMRKDRLVLGAAIAAMTTGLAGMAGGQTRPAEPPPPRFSEREYVDSAGCVFARVGITATIGWVPRIGPDGKPVCGKEPTFAPAPSHLPDAEPAAADTAAAPEEATPKVAAPPAPAKAAKPRKHRPPAPLVIVETEAIDMPPAPCPRHAGQAVRFWLSDGRRITKCGPAPEDGLAFVNGLGVPGLAVQGVSPDPSAAGRARAKGQKGYRVSWTSTEAGPASAAPSADGSGAGRYVQIGAFADPANADRALAALAGLGLPSARAQVRGGRLTAILAGPFEDGETLAQTLALVRQSGFPQAFARD